MTDATHTSPRGACASYLWTRSPNPRRATLDRWIESCRCYAIRSGLALDDALIFVDRGTSGVSLDLLRDHARNGRIKTVLLPDWSAFRSPPKVLPNLFQEFEALGIETHVTGGPFVGPIDAISLVVLSLFAIEERLKRSSTQRAAAHRARRRRGPQSAEPRP